MEETLFSNENTRGMLIREKLLQKSVNLEVDNLFYFMYKYLCLEYYGWIERLEGGYIFG